MGALVLALTLGIMVRSWLSPTLRVPYTVLVLIVGLAVGFIAYTEERTTGSDIFSRSVGVWLGISPEAILNGGWGWDGMGERAEVWILFLRTGRKHLRSSCIYLRSTHDTHTHTPHYDSHPPHPHLRE